MLLCANQVLEQVYIAHDNLDDELVNSIVWPAQHPNAAEAFYKIITGKGTPVNWLLKRLDKVGSVNKETYLLSVTCSFGICTREDF